ncbi:MAG: hypothetical protein RJB39_392 [Candidatus Parcubacteria bacterium]|jgi:hypothetical protein
MPEINLKPHTEEDQPLGPALLSRLGTRGLRVLHIPAPFQHQSPHDCLFEVVRIECKEIISLCHILRLLEEYFQSLGWRAILHLVEHPTEPYIGGDVYTGEDLGYQRVTVQYEPGLAAYPVLKVEMDYLRG